MKVLFDQGTPVPLREYLSGYEIDTAFERGWADLENGDLITAAEEAGFQIFVTTDQSMKYQQNLVQRELAIVVLLTTSWPRIQKQVSKIQTVLEQLSVGEYIEIEI